MDGLEDIQRQLGSIEGKQDMILAMQEDHGKRISELEKFKNMALGICTAVGAIAGGIFAFMKEVLIPHNHV